MREHKKQKSAECYETYLRITAEILRNFPFLSSSCYINHSPSVVYQLLLLTSLPLLTSWY